MLVTVGDVPLTSRRCQRAWSTRQVVRTAQGCQALSFVVFSTQGAMDNMTGRFLNTNTPVEDTFSRLSLPGGGLTEFTGQFGIQTKSEICFPLVKGPLGLRQTLGLQAAWVAIDLGGPGCRHRSAGQSRRKCTRASRESAVGAVLAPATTCYVQAPPVQEACGGRQGT